MFVGWGATHVGGFPDLSDVALERSATQHSTLIIMFWMLGYVPPPNLHTINVFVFYLMRVIEEY
jgi:hypothetical protein